MDKIKDRTNHYTAYLVIQKIKKALEIMLGLLIVVLLWFIPLGILQFFGIGHS